MGTSIPLPALHAQAPQQQDPVEQYARLAQLKQMMANQPLQQQALQQQVQAGQQENQMRAQQIKDQQAMTAAMQQWDGKDFNSLTPLVVKNGGSAQAVMGLRSKQLEMQQTLSKIAADDATTGSKNIETMKQKNDMVSGALSNVLQQPDQALPQALMQTAQELAQKGVLDPQHAQAAAQMAQSGDPNAIRQQLTSMQKGLMSQTQLMEKASKEATTREQNSIASKNEAETAAYQKMGLAPGVSAELLGMADWLKKNPSKGASDFLAWKAKQAPLANFNMQMAAGGGLQSGALDQAAQRYLTTGQLPPGGRGAAGLAQNRAIMNRASELGQGQDLSQNAAVYKANKDSLTKLQTNFDQVSAFESTAKKNIDLLQETAKQIPDLGARFANVPVRIISDKMIGSDKMAAFKTALNTAQTEAAKVLNSSNASGVLSDSARHELQQIVDGNMPYSAMVASLNTLKQDMANRHQAYQEQISDIQGRLKPAGSSQPANTQPNTQQNSSSPLTIKLPSGKSVEIQ